MKIFENDGRQQKCKKKCFITSYYIKIHFYCIKITLDSLTRHSGLEKSQKKNYMQ